MIGRRLRGAAVVGVILTWALLPVPARAAGPTSLTLETDQAISVGVHPAVAVHLSDVTGPISGALVEIRLDGRQTERVITDGSGTATAVLARDLGVGDYDVQAVFRGTVDHPPSASLVTRVRVDPATFTVRTVPPVPNVALLRVDGGPILSTDADGTVRIPIRSVRRYAFEVTIPAAEADRRLAFVRWGDGSRETRRSIRLPGRVDLVIGLELAYPVAFSFVDSTGAAVDPIRIETFLLADDRGATLEPAPLEPAWLVGNRIVRGADGLGSVPVEYRIQEVGVRGSNVVDRGRLHFLPDGELSTWSIPLLLYSLTINAEDALFGTPLGSSVRLQYPNETVESVSLDTRSSATISSLPRGNYRAVVERPAGFGVATPIVLSREQTVRVPVISYLDVAFVIGSGLLIALALVLFGGRPIGRMGRRAFQRVGAAVLAPARLPGALVRATVGAIPVRRRQDPAPALASSGGSSFAFAAGPLELAAVAAAPPSVAAPVSAAPPAVFRDVDRWGLPIGRGRRHRHCPDCANRLTPRARLCRACGRRVRRS